MPEPVALRRIRPVPDPAPDPAPAVPPHPMPVRARARDRRLDVFRGLALTMIFVNHVPGTVYETLTSRNFGFSDAAEGFVYMAGISAALAYSSGLARSPLWPAVTRIWGRAWTLYLVQLLIMAWAVAIAAGTYRFFGVQSMLNANNLEHLESDPVGFVIGVPLMTHQIGYVNILPLYAVLLVASPLVLILAMHWPWRTMIGSIALWALSGLYKIDLPNYPTTGGWFFNPFSWQVLFVAGLCTGLALKRGERFVPRRRWLFWPAVAYLVMSLIWLRWLPFAEAGNQALGWVASLGVPSFIRDFDKTYVAVPRLLHIASLAYVITCLPIIRRSCDSRWAEPLAVLGRNALPVFVLGTVLAFAGQAVKAIYPAGLLLDTALILIGLALLVGLAVLRDGLRTPSAAAGIPKT